MERKPPRQGVQLADLLRRSQELKQAQPPTPAETEAAPKPAAPAQPAAPPPAQPPGAVPRAPAARVPPPPVPVAGAPVRPAAAETDEEARSVTIELVLSSKQLANILSDHAPEVMTLEQAANYLQVGPDYLARLARLGRVPGTKLGRSWRFKRSLLDDWLAERSQSEEESADDEIEDDERA